jgi:hypothetical protein
LSIYAAALKTSSRRFARSSRDLVAALIITGVLVD